MPLIIDINGGIPMRKLASILSPAKIAVTILLMLGVIVLGASIVDTASRYPAWYGLPETIQGYKIVAVYSAQNTPCIAPTTIQIVVQPLENGTKAAPRELNRTLRQLVRPKYAYVQLHIVTPPWSPDITFTDLVERVKSKFIPRPCPARLGGPIVSVTPRATLIPRETATP
jgi:hypothetical protein